MADERVVATLVVTGKNLRESAALECRVCNGNHFLFSMVLASLHGNEEDLNDGRFRQFSHQQQPNKVYLRRNFAIGFELRHWYTDVLGWIAEHCREPWSVGFEAHSVGDMTFEFAFAKVSSAVAFALVFS